MVDDKQQVSAEPHVSEILNQYFFPGFINNIITRHIDKQVDISDVCSAIKTAISVDVLINNLAEVFRLSRNVIEQDLSDFGLADIIRQYHINVVSNADTNQSQSEALYLCADSGSVNPFPDLFKIHSSAGIESPIQLSSILKQSFEGLVDDVSNKFKDDPFAELYRSSVLDYYTGFMSETAPVIEREIQKLFNGKYPRYMVTTGIGANEQFTHLAAAINNKSADRRLRWLIVNSPKELLYLPEDATIDNTIFVEFSRSSLTEETVKTHEYTPRDAKRIVFSNAGPLKEIAQRDHNLVLSLPDKVSGRYGRNKTPILLAPMFIAGMDTEQYWNDIEMSIQAFDISNVNSLPIVIAKFILIYQKICATNFIYFGCNDTELGLLADQFIQYWNEGVNKAGNDILTSRFFGLPRDSHMNIEGVLGNRDNKMGFFLLKTNMRDSKLHPMISPIIDAINPDHAGLHYGDEEVILAIANFKRFSEVMPTFLIEIPSEITLTHSAVLGQLFADVTFVYSRLVGIDPGSNPEVKYVRERSASLLSSVAKIIREDDLPIEDSIWK
jgi:hypothetical protein